MSLETVKHTRPFVAGRVADLLCMQFILPKLGRGRTGKITARREKYITHAITGLPVAARGCPHRRT